MYESIRRALGSAKVTSILEPPGLDQGDNKRPDGLTIYPWKFGKPLVWDVTVVDTLASSYNATTPAKAGGAAEPAESRKQRKCELFEDRFIVQPVGFETLGSWGPAARTFLSDIGRRIEQATGRERSSEFLRQRIGMEIQRGNAASVMGTAETSKDWDKYFLLLS